MQRTWCWIAALCAAGFLLMSVALPLGRPAQAQSMGQQSAPDAPAQARQLFVRGMTYAQLGEHDRAVSLYERALKLAPDEAALLAAMATSQAAQDELQTALYYAEQAVNAAPSNPAYYTQLADLQEQSGNLDAAVATYRERTRRFPDDAAARLKLARLLAETNRPEEALKQYEDIVSARGGTASMRMEMLRLYRQVDDAEGIRTTLETLVEDHPEEPFFRSLLAEFYLQRNEPERAIAMYERALEANPANVDAALKLATLYQQQGAPDKAEALLDDALGSNQATPDQLVRQAEALLQRDTAGANATQTATQLLERALAMRPQHEAALTLLGTLRYQNGEYAAAAEVLQRSLDANPRSPERWFRTAAAYLQSGAPEQAATVAEDGLLLFPGQYPLVRVSAYALMETNQNDAALGRFAEALELLSDGRPEERARLLAAQGLLHSRKQEHAASDARYEQALKADPDQAFALNNYAYSLAERGTKLDRALTLAQQAVEQDATNASFLDTLGWVHFQRGDYQAAKRWLQQALDTGAASATTYEHMGDVHEALGDPAAARTYWQQALDRAPDRSAIQDKLDALPR